jgi:spermidine/putrescine transport system ATP-binding protein
LRREMQVEVRALQRQLQATFIQVTHSQEEALTMSDRIAVMNRGRIEQLGTPADIFDRPATRFVAAFMGMTNLVDGIVTAIDGKIVRLEAAGHALSGAWSGPRPPAIGQTAFMAVHPQRIVLGGQVAGDGWSHIDGHTITAAYKGAHTDVTIATGLGVLTAAIADIGIADGALVSLAWRDGDCAIGPLE